jgi:YHS domain-containing protein
MKTIRTLLIFALALGAVRLTSAQEVKLPKRIICPVDYKSFAPTAQSAFILMNGEPKYLCSTGCKDRLVVWPEKYLKTETVKCTVQPNFNSHIDLPRRVEVNNGLYYLCCAPCVGWMQEKPWLYLKEIKDPVSGKPFTVAETSPRSNVKGQVYLFESAETKATFDKEPAKYVIPFRK